jgi:predicted NBD/HSP70 family sugar kinase
VREIFDRLGEDEAARRTIDEVARIIAIAILAVQSVIDPEVVLLGGSIGVRPELRTQVAAQLARCMRDPVPVEISALGSRATLVGAIGSAIDMVHRKVFGIGADSASRAPSWTTSP